MTGAEKKLVQAYFGKTQIDIEGLNTILEKTGNSQYALDLLLGTTETIPTPPQEALDYDDELMVFQSYDPWKCQVTYTAAGRGLIYLNVPVGVQQADVTLENYEQYKDIPASNETRALGFRFGSPTSFTHEMSLERWLEGAKRKERKENNR